MEADRVNLLCVACETSHQLLFYFVGSGFVIIVVVIRLQFTFKVDGFLPCRMSSGSVRVSFRPPSGTRHTRIFASSPAEMHTKLYLSEYTHNDKSPIKKDVIYPPVSHIFDKNFFFFYHKSPYYK